MAACQTLAQLQSKRTDRDIHASLCPAHLLSYECMYVSIISLPLEVGH